VIVRGDYRGTGTATVSTASVQLTAQITDCNGNAGSLTLGGPVVNHRFAGTGSVMGMAMSFNGRVDVADSFNQANTVLHSTRLVVTLSTPDGHFARVAGAPK
jgi:hypothetical protein